MLENFTGYEKKNWKNSPDKTTPLSAENLDHMDSGIKMNADAVIELREQAKEQKKKTDAALSAVNTNKIFFRDVAYTAVQIGADGYGVTSAGIGKDEKVIGSSILTWGTGVIYGGPTLGDKGSGYGYLFGPPNTVVTGLSIRWKIVKS